MFGTLNAQNTKNLNEAKTVPIFDPGIIPTHIMQDDLDVLSGKIKNPNPGHLKESLPDPFNELNRDSNKRSSSVPISQSSSPFFDGSTPAINNLSGVQKSTGISNVSVNVPEGAAKSANFGRVAGVFVAMAAVLGALGGGYYFYLTRYNNPPVEIPEITPADVVPEKTPEEIIVPEKFVADKPNYLMIDVEKTDALAIQRLILQKAVEIREDKKSTPIEFVVVDANNNPIAFKIFALLMKVNLSQKILDNLTDRFSLFIFSDQGNTRVGLNLSPRDGKKFAADIKTEEKTLIKNMTPVFLGEAVASKPALFNDSQYGHFPIRYLNLNEQNSLSIDYCYFAQDQFIISTSKSTERAIIDKLIRDQGMGF